MEHNRQNFSCTLIIPFLNSSPERARNLTFVLDKIPKELPLIVVAQKIDGKENLTFLKQRSNSHTLELSTKGTAIEKAMLINKAVLSATTDYVWVTDADVVLPFKEVISIAREKVPCFQAVKPYRYFLKLNDDETSLFMKKRKIQNTNGHKVYKMVLGAASFIVRRDAYLEIGGMDEKYTGWGFEDYDFSIRFLSSRFKFFETDNPAIHLFHKRARMNRNNLELFKKKWFLKTA